MNKIAAKAKQPGAWEFICVDCGKQASDFDHRYYGQPLIMDAVCKGCNVRRGSALDVGEMTRKLMSYGEVKLFKLLNKVKA